MLSVMADEFTTGWCSRSYYSSEPRLAIPNHPSHGYSYHVEFPWYRSCAAIAAIAAVRDGLIAIAGRDGELFTDDDLEIGDRGADTPRAIAFAKFVQGLAHGYLGMLYDRAFIVDETTDLAAQEFADVKAYHEVTNAAVEYLQEAIEVASRYAFDIPPEWVGGAVVDNGR